MTNAIPAAATSVIATTTYATTVTLRPKAHYIRLSVNPAEGVDELALRKCIQQALAQSFGTNFANVYLDILSLHISERRVDQGGNDRERAEAVIRVACEDLSRIKAAVAFAAASTQGALRLSVANDSSFLPALL